MNFRYVSRLLGLLLGVLAASTALALVVEWVGYASASQAERMSLYALLWATCVTGAAGGLLWAVGRHTRVEQLNRRDALLLVALAWLIGAGFAASPYFAWSLLGGTAALPEGPAHPFESFAACYFEAMSGLTTTGATVLAAPPNDIETLPKGLLLWRAMTHWLGGLGIVVLFVAVLPVVGVGGKKLFQIEAPGPKAQGVRPRIKETARVLWLIYLALTAAQTVAYALAGMPWFDAVCHTFATLATGGFSTRNASIGYYYDTPSVDVITIVFMLLAGINFGLYYQLVNRKFSAVYKDPELRLYLGIIAVATITIAAWLWHDPVTTTGGKQHHEGALFAVRDSLFQVVSIMTTTGYCTIDFEQWPFGPKAILVGLMFVGGMAGSTGGGCKVVRFLIAGKIIAAEFERIFRPRIIKPIRVGGETVDNDTARSVLIYLLLVVVIFALGSVALMLLEPANELTYTSAATATIATFMNVGPGLDAVGAVDNYGFFTPASKSVMALLMALGRLELFAILVLLTPRFWFER